MYDSAVMKVSIFGLIQRNTALVYVPVFVPAMVIMEVGKMGQILVGRGSFYILPV